VVLDDACHYMRKHNLTGKHCTVLIPPNPDEILDREFLRHKASALSFVPEVENNGPKLLVWSAADQESLSNLTAAYSQHFAKEGETLLPADGYLKDLAYTLSERRTLLPWRSFAVAETLEELTDMKSLLSLPVPSSTDLRLGFVFTGQGAQWVGMGRALFAYPTFRKSIDEATEYLKTLGCDWSIEGIVTEFPQCR
jgi:acyl transferase domain-containing protein